MAAGGEAEIDLVLADSTDRLLARIEICVIYLLSIAVIFSIILLSLWVATGRVAAVHSRLIDTCKFFHENWRPLFILLLPLLFRPARKFLLNLRKGPFGIEAEPEAEPKSGKYP